MTPPKVIWKTFHIWQDLSSYFLLHALMTQSILNVRTKWQAIYKTPVNGFCSSGGEGDDGTNVSVTRGGFHTDRSPGHDQPFSPAYDFTGAETESTGIPNWFFPSASWHIDYFPDHIPPGECTNSLLIFWQQPGARENGDHLVRFSLIFRTADLQAAEVLGEDFLR